MIKAIGFDYNGVVTGITGPEFNKGVCKILDISVKQYEEQYFKVNKLLNTGSLSRDDFWKLFLEKFNKLDKHKELLDYIKSVSDHKINADVLTLVGELKAKGYKLGLLTNNNFAEAEGIKQRLSEHFDVIAVSSDMNLMKPSVEIFNVFFDKLGVKAEEAIFIDDSKQSLLFADKLKFKPILFTNAETLRKELKNLE